MGYFRVILGLVLFFLRSFEVILGLFGSYFGLICSCFGVNLNFFVGDLGIFFGGGGYFLVILWLFKRFLWDIWNDFRVILVYFGVLRGYFDLIFFF